MKLQISIPKAGSHVFAQMTQSTPINVLLRNKSCPIGQFASVGVIKSALENAERGKYQNYCIHMPYHASLEETIRSFEIVILILRDPRDIILSHAHFVKKFPSNALNYKVSESVLLSQLELHDRIDFLIHNMPLAFEHFDKWKKSGIPDVFYYEDYVTEPFIVFDQLSRMGYGTVAEIKARSKNKGRGFRKGLIGEHRYVFTKKQMELCDELFGDIVESWRR